MVPGTNTRASSKTPLPHEALASNWARKGAAATLAAELAEVQADPSGTGSDTTAVATGEAHARRHEQLRHALIAREAALTVIDRSTIADVIAHALDA